MSAETIKYGHLTKEMEKDVEGLRNTKVDNCYTCPLCGIGHPDGYSCKDDPNSTYNWRKRREN